MGGLPRGGGGLGERLWAPGWERFGGGGRLLPAWEGLGRRSSGQRVPAQEHGLGRRGQLAPCDEVLGVDGVGSSGHQGGQRERSRGPSCSGSWPLRHPTPGSWSALRTGPAGPPPGRPPLTHMDRVCPLSLQADGSRVQGEYGPRSTSWAGMPAVGEAPLWPFQPAAPQAPSDTSQVSRRKSQPPSWLPAPSLPTGLVVGHWPLGQRTSLLVWSRLAWGGQEGGRWCPVPWPAQPQPCSSKGGGSRGHSRLLLRGRSRAHSALWGTFLLPV